MSATDLEGLAELARAIEALGRVAVELKWSEAVETEAHAAVAYARSAQRHFAPRPPAAVPTQPKDAAL